VITKIFEARSLADSHFAKNAKFNYELAKSVGLEKFLDQLDLKILHALRNDARKPFLNLARKLKVSDATIHMRVRRLRKEGVIRGFYTDIDDRKLGYDTTAFIRVRLVPGTTDAVVRGLSTIRGIVEMHEVHSHSDLLLKVKAKSLAELRNKLVTEIGRVPNIVSKETSVVLRVVKENGIPY
jgi:Lrp/AsnC family transcriptional regulator for asnA, asnC and gidA